MGLTGYFRKFVYNYSILARPLSELLKKDRKFVFGAEQRPSFESLKVAISTNPVLHIFRQNARTELHTDASKQGFGAILFQRAYDNSLHPVYFMSRKLHQLTKKCIAISWK